MRGLHRFIGKFCTVSTLQINFRFKEEQMFDYFSGILEEVDEHGLLLRHATTRCLNYIFMQHVVSVSEEQVLYEDNPEDAEAIKEYREKKPQAAARTVLPAQNISFLKPEALADLAEKARQSFGK